MKLLVIYRGLPWPITEGYHLRILHIFRRLAKRHDIHLLSFIQSAEQEAALEPLKNECLFKSISLIRVPGRKLFGRALTNIGCNPVRSFHAEYPGFSLRVKKKVRELKELLQLDAGYVFDPWADLWTSEAISELPILLDVCDCRSLYYERQLNIGTYTFLQRLRIKQLLRRFRGYEKNLLATYPLSTVVSPLDKQALEQLSPKSHTEVIPNGVDLDMFAPVSNIEEEPKTLILFGNMDFLPNYDAAIHFAKDILPLVQEKHPETKFLIVGTNPLPEVLSLSKLKGVEVTGRVPDLKEYIQRATMLVAPMRYGAGIKNKVLEAMAVEKPVVTNSMGVEAMHPQVRKLLCVADNNISFARHVCNLLDSPEDRKKLGKMGREAMGELHSWDSVANSYEKLFKELVFE